MFFRRKKLTVIINFYNMRREAERTLFTLTSKYQNLSSKYYDVIALHNGSTQPLNKQWVESFGSNFRYFYFQSKHPSPVEAINHYVKKSKNEFVMCLIDGARMLSPKLLQYTLDAIKLAKHPFIYTVGMHIEHQMQNHLVTKGYNQNEEDKLIATVNWKDNGYELFSIASLAGSSQGGYFSYINESNCFTLKKKDFIKMGGYNEKFISPGGGLVNLDFFNKANEQLDFTPVLLLGEATFHQFHGGVATNVPMQEHPWKKMTEEYRSIYCLEFESHQRKPMYYGCLNDEYHKRFIVKTKEEER